MYFTPSRSLGAKEIHSYMDVVAPAAVTSSLQHPGLYVTFAVSSKHTQRDLNQWRK